MSHLKIVNASRGSIQKFENLKRKLYRCNANIYFNKQCLKKQLTPSYANIKVPNTSPAHKYTQHKLSAIRIKDEIKYLHSKKQQLNQQIYHLHLHLTNTWHNMWPHLQHTIESRLRQEISSKYKTLDKKLMRLTQTQKTTPLEQHTFYPRVVNNTNINFSNNEMRLLHKGLKYNMHTKKKNWVQTLALEAETAITHLPTTERDVYRKLVADWIDKFQRQNPTHRTHPEAKMIHSIQRKLKDNDAMITYTDKGNSMVILPTHQYEAKLQDLLRNKDFHTITTDPTPTFQTQIRASVRQSLTLIPKEQKWKYINMNPSAPSIKGLIKLHKPDQPIRPVVNWRNAPAYRFSRLFTDKINHLAPLPNSLP